MGETPPRLADLLRAAGARELPNGRLGLPGPLVHDAIARAAKTFILHGRDDTRSIEVGGDKVHFGTGGAAVQTLDLDTGHYRPSTLRDLHDFTRLQDTPGQCQLVHPLLHRNRRPRPLRTRRQHPLTP